MATNRAFEPHVQRAVSELRTLRDRLRLKLHLVGMEGKDVWQRLEPELDRVVERLELSMKEAATLGDRVGDEAELQLHLAWMDARDRWQGVEPHIDRMVERGQSLGNEVADAAERAMEETHLQATLAKMDAQDSIRDHRDSVMRQLRDGWEGFRTQSLDGLGELKASFHRLVNALGATQPKPGE